MRNSIYSTTYKVNPIFISAQTILGNGMNHKRGKPKNARAGCLMCKPNKMNGWNKLHFGHKGFSKLRKAIHAQQDIQLDKNF